GLGSGDFVVPQDTTFPRCLDVGFSILRQQETFSNELSRTGPDRTDEAFVVLVALLERRARIAAGFAFSLRPGERQVGAPQREEVRRPRARPAIPSDIRAQRNTGQQ